MLVCGYRRVLPWLFLYFWLVFWRFASIFLHGSVTAFFVEASSRSLRFCFGFHEIVAFACLFASSACFALTCLFCGFFSSFFLFVPEQLTVFQAVLGVPVQPCLFLRSFFQQPMKMPIQALPPSDRLRFDPRVLHAFVLLNLLRPESTSMMKCSMDEPSRLPQ